MVEKRLYDYDEEEEEEKEEEEKSLFYKLIATLNSLVF